MYQAVTEAWSYFLGGKTPRDVIIIMIVLPRHCNRSNEALEALWIVLTNRSEKVHLLCGLLGVQDTPTLHWDVELDCRMETRLIHGA